MSGASVEDTLELWVSSLRDVKAQIRPLFAHPSVADSAAAYVDGLLGPERRKTGWMRAEAAGDPGPWRQQAVLGRSRWDADALRDMVRDYVVEALGEPDAVLVIDETGFLKQGKASCGVARQYTGSAGKITNCQIGVFAAYVSSKGHAFIDRALYLPRSWTSARARRACARGGGLCHQAASCGGDDQARHLGAGSVPMGGARHRLRRERGRDGAPAGGQGVCARRQRHRSVRLLGQGAGCGRHSRADRAGA